VAGTPQSLSVVAAAAAAAAVAYTMMIKHPRVYITTL